MVGMVVCFRIDGGLPLAEALERVVGMMAYVKALLRKRKQDTSFILKESDEPDHPTSQCGKTKRASDSYSSLTRRLSTTVVVVTTC